MDLKIPELVVDSCCRMNKRPFADPTPIPRLTYTVHRPHITQQPRFVSTQLFAMMSVVSSEGIYHHHTLFPSTPTPLPPHLYCFPLPPHHQYISFVFSPISPTHFYCFPPPPRTSHFHCFPTTITFLLSSIYLRHHR